MTTSALRTSAAALTVSRPGSPGPLPTNATFPRGPFGVLVGFGVLVALAALAAPAALLVERAAARGVVVRDDPGVEGEAVDLAIVFFTVLS